jgi:lipoyl(octanoyl) transferase
MNYKVVRVKEPMTYTEGAMLQHQMFASVKGEYDGVLLILEHKHVITTGMDADLSDLLVSKEDLEEKGIDISKTDRLGGITYHGPGQVVIYPVFKLDKLNIAFDEYQHKLELAINDTVSKYGVVPHQKEGCFGVWVEDSKICFVGPKERKSIVYHGLGLDVTTDKSYFNLINPCGVIDHKITTLKDFVNDVDIEEVKDRVVESFTNVFNVTFEKMEMKDIMPAGAQRPPGTHGHPGAKRPAGTHGEPGAKRPAWTHGDSGAKRPEGTHGHPGAERPAGTQGHPGAEKPSGTQGHPGGERPAGTHGHPGAKRPAWTYGDSEPKK